MYTLAAFCVVWIVAAHCVFGGELTFELPDNDKMCFYENVDKGVQATIEFQVMKF